MHFIFSDTNPGKSSLFSYPLKPRILSRTKQGTICFESGKNNIHILLSTEFICLKKQYLKFYVLAYSENDFFANARGRGFLFGTFYRYRYQAIKKFADVSYVPESYYQTEWN